MPSLSCPEIIAEFLHQAGVQYGIFVRHPESVAWMESFKDRVKAFFALRAEGATNIAVGFCRASGRPPAILLHGEANALNALSAMASAHMDSTPLMVFVIGAGRVARLFETVVKRDFFVADSAQLPDALACAWNVMTSGRRGPVTIHISVEAQAQTADVEVPNPRERQAHGRIFGDTAEIDRAVRLVKAAKRPVFLAGGGVLVSGASPELLGLAEHVGAPVITTLMGKSAFPEDHPLFAGQVSFPGTACANRIIASADVLLAVGCRFCDDWTKDPRLSITPTHLIHVDIDPATIGRKYPVAVGIVGDAKMVLSNMLRKLRDSTKPRLYVSEPYFQEVTRLKKEWTKSLRARDAARAGLTLSALLSEVRRYLDRDAIVIVSSGAPQMRAAEELPVYMPGTFISPGHLAVSGFALPAAVGAKLAMPDKKVLGIGDVPDFMAALHELSVWANQNVAVTVIVLNGAAKELRNPPIATLARDMGCYSEDVERAQDVRNALKRAFNSGRTAVLVATLT